MQRRDAAKLPERRQESCTRQHLDKIHSAVSIAAGNMQNYLTIVTARQVGKPLQALEAHKHFASEPASLEPHGINLGLRNEDFSHVALEQVQHGVLNDKFEDELGAAGLCQAFALSETRNQVWHCERKRDDLIGRHFEIFFH